jgi:hypothetical protein
MVPLSLYYHFIYYTISAFKAVLKGLNEWCKHNRLYINWSKTFLMLITNKRVNLSEFDVTKIQVVSKFKLLGVIIDNKLNFKEHVSQQCASINKRLFSIKRLFYMSFDVNLQFFKSFIMFIMLRLLFDVVNLLQQWSNQQADENVLS